MSAVIKEHAAEQEAVAVPPPAPKMKGFFVSRETPATPSVTPWQT